LKKAKKTGKIIVQEIPAVNAEGDEIWFHSTFIPVKNDKGKVEYIIVLSIDVNERKKGEESLKQTLQEKDVLLKEVHHRVKNNMMVLYGLSPGGKSPLFL